ncbi:Ankyrin repeat-containing protein [Thalictrum thalictroides]|uniref:Ankyrin repeat-containing protein n=1 Tax=Thalictrum thalictroides TaxID=46969 RepID=A0A7J6VZM4_THATH|nr:Ankyrin repeat-containing protein [Thalictrum thalictroides]
MASFRKQEMDSITISVDHEISLHPKENEEIGFPSVQEDDDYTWTKNVILAMDKDNWNCFKDYVYVLPGAKARKVNEEGETFLHLAVARGKEQFVKGLVNLMSPEDLLLTDKYGYTALSLAAISGTKEMAEIMVEKNPKLLLVHNKVSDDIHEIPVVTAARHENTDMVHYLYEHTPKDQLDPDKGKDGATLLTKLIISDLFDIALDLLNKYPTLAIADDYDKRNAITELARKPSTFPSGRRHKLWQKFKSTLGFKIREGKSEMQALQILEIISTQVSKLDDKQLEAAGVYKAVLEATKFGIVEFVFTVMKYNQHLENCKDASGRGILLYAIMYRQERVFNLLQNISDRKNRFSYIGKETGNNTLHEAAIYNRFSQIDRISGVALQMQRELQWFEEVEKLVPPKLKDQLNNQGLTPRDLFAEEHAALVEKGEKWMKETATGCMVVAALIATVVFTAAFTIPGGNDDKGNPIFIKSDMFIIFIIMDALSLFTSCSSMLMFLAILTSRYAKQDFLLSLPRKLILGLSSLFLSIGTMMAAFCATLFIVIRNENSEENSKDNSWVPVTGTVLAALPVTLFIMLQFPLLVDMIYKTYGPSVFAKKNKDMSL